MVAPAEVVRTGLPSEVEPKSAVRKSSAQQLHTIIRTISKTGGNVSDSMPIIQIEAYLAEYFSAGWRLFSVSPLANVPEGHIVMWTLVRDI